MNRTQVLAVLVLVTGMGRICLGDVQYTVTDLGTLGGTKSYANSLNDAGQVVGYSYTASGDTHAFLYSGGQMQDLGTLGGTNSTATGINNSGQVVGYADTTQFVVGVGLPYGYYAHHAFLYSGGKIQDLGTLPDLTDSSAIGINDVGQVIGSATYYNDGIIHGVTVLYSNGVMQSTGNTNGGVYGINNYGQTVGYANFNGNQHAFLTSGGQMQDLGTLGGTQSYAYGINTGGQVVGVSNTASDASHAFLYSGGQMQDLGTFGGTYSYANGINNSGQVVGWAETTGDYYNAFLYSGGTMIDLNTLIAPTSGWWLEQATAINGVGQIVGLGFNSATGQYEAFLLTPIPEPATLSLLALGGLAVLRRKKRN